MNPGAGQEESRNLSKSFLAVGLLVSALALTGCNRNPLLVTRSSCPAVAVPSFVGSVTKFDPPQSRDADAIDVTAQLTDVVGTCTETAEYLSTEVSFKVTAQRRKPGPARQLYLPIFVGLAQGGTVLVSKQVTGVMLEFPEGQLRAETRGGAQAQVHRSAVTLPPEVQERITRERRPDEPDALVDPLSDPQVRAAVRAASFEVLVGFQLDDASLAYNVGK